MELSEAIVEAMAQLADVPAAPQDVHGIGAFFGDENTRKGHTAVVRGIAQITGVSERTVQRWIAPDTAKQHRSPSAANLDKLRAYSDIVTRQKLDAQLEHIEQNGITVDIAGDVRVSKDKRPRSIDNIKLAPGDEAFKAFMEAFKAGEYDDAADAFTTAFFDAYPIAGASFDDVDELAIRGNA